MLLQVIPSTLCLHIFPPVDLNSPAAAEALPAPVSGAGYAGGTCKLKRVGSKEACDQALSADGRTLLFQDSRCIPEGTGGRMLLYLPSSFTCCFAPPLAIGDKLQIVLVKVCIQLRDYDRLPDQCKTGEVKSKVLRLRNAAATQATAARLLELTRQQDMPDRGHAAAAPPRPVAAAPSPDILITASTFNASIRCYRKGDTGMSLTLTCGGKEISFFSKWRFISITAVGRGRV